MCKYSGQNSTKEFWEINYTDWTFKYKGTVPSNLKQPNVSKYLEELHKRFIITNIDKAGNNFGVVCKKYYIDVLKKELGVNNVSDIKGNDVYTLHTGNINALINQHKDDLHKNFNINVSDDNF